MDLVYTLWGATKGAPASVIERVMKEKYEGNGGEEVGDKCSVCYEDLQFNGEKIKEKEAEVSILGCGHA